MGKGGRGEITYLANLAASLASTVTAFPPMETCQQTEKEGRMEGRKEGRKAMRGQQHKGLNQLHNAREHRINYNFDNDIQQFNDEPPW